jgi:hypothetical protein
VEFIMAIIGVKTTLKATAVAKTGGIKTGLVWWMDRGTDKGQSSDLLPGVYSTFLGKSLGAAGDSSLARAIPVAARDN